MKTEFLAKADFGSRNEDLLYPTGSSASGLSYHATFGQCYYSVSHGLVLEDVIGELQ